MCIRDSPNDTTNEARALLLLQDNGIIKLADGAGITATKNDIVENPYNVEIVETEAAQIPNILQDVDYAVINSNYAINAGLNPVADSLVIEGSASAYANILAVKEGNESSPKAVSYTHLCADAGQSALSSLLAAAGTLCALVCALPLMEALLEMVEGFL